MNDMEYKVQGLNKLSKQFNQFVIEAGFNGNDFPLRMMLTVSELSEAFEAFRKDKYANRVQFKNTRGDFKMNFEENIKDTLEDELADSLIRLLDLCGYLDIDIEWHVQQKMKYNKSRGFKYGGKKF
jgi:NTP pyrophosphatase (non-canonical NTP hydrolase)